MQLIPLNAKVIVFLYFIINIVNFIECSTLDNDFVASSLNDDHAIDTTKLSSVIEHSIADDSITSDAKQVVADPIGAAKRLRNAVYGTRQHNYRSSYVGNKFDRRVTSSSSLSTADDTIAATEQIPLIKAKRKVYNDFSEEIKYNVGPGVNIGVEKDKELVSVYLDEDCLKDVFTGIILHFIHYSHLYRKKATSISNFIHRNTIFIVIFVFHLFLHLK